MFTVLGITATFAAGPLVDYLPALRTIGGLVLIVLGLDLAGLLHIPVLQPDLAPARRRRGGFAGDRDRHDGASAAAPAAPSVGDRVGGRVVSSRGGWLASFGLGAIFAIGWSPCIGIILGGDPDDGRDIRRRSLQGAVLLVAYTIGLGLPFLDPRGRLRPRAAGHGAARPPRQDGLADRRPAGRRSSASRWSSTGSSLLPRYFNFNTAI